MKAHDNLVKLVDTTKPMLTIKELLSLNLSEAEIKKYLSIYQYSYRTLKEINNG